MSVNPTKVFELDKLFAMLKEEAFERNDLLFFKRYQKLIEEQAELPGFKFFPEVVFRQGSMLHPQSHEYEFGDLLKRSKGKIISYEVGLRAKFSKAQSVDQHNVESVLMSEEELLGLLYALFEGNSPIKLDIDRYFYLYSKSELGMVLKTWINWKGDHWAIKSSSNDINHSFGGDNVLIQLTK